MRYEYSAANRLDTPHHYMYAPYQGRALIAAYVAAREAAVDGVRAASGGANEPWLTSARGYVERRQTAGATAPKTSIASFSIADTTSTDRLLESLIGTQLAGIDEPIVKDWLDRLTQRFEVTKKLFERYPAGFRKGEGDTRSVRRYWLFAVALALACARTNHLKFVSALLKVNDLLCSLPADDLAAGLPAGGLEFVVGVERHCVERIGKKAGVPLAAH